MRRTAPIACSIVLLLVTGVAAQDIREIADLNYGKDGHEGQILSAHLLVQEKPAPVMVFINSGGWHSGHAGRNARGNHESRAFNQAGFSTVFVSHRDVDVAPWPAQIDDVSRAIQFIRSKEKDWNVDPKRFGVIGRSSGGHLAMMAGFLPDRAKPNSDDPVERFSSKVNCVIEMAGPTDLVSQVKGIMRQAVEGNQGIGVRGSLMKLLNMTEDQAESEEFYRRLAEISPINFVGKDTPPVFIQYVGPEDATSPDDPRLKWAVHTPISGLQLAQKLEECSVPHEVLIVPDPKEREDEIIQSHIKFVKEHCGIKYTPMLRASKS